MMDNERSPLRLQKRGIFLLPSLRKNRKIKDILDNICCSKIEKKRSVLLEKRAFFAFILKKQVF